MKIAISSTGPSLESAVDNRFGRCQYFIIYDIETREYKSLSNEAISASGGAGIQVAQFIKKQGAEIVLTGNVGPNAMSTLSAAKIGVVVGVSGSIKEAIAKYLTGEYKLTEQANVSSHFGFREE